MQHTYHVTVGRNGRVVLPSEVRRALHLQVGEKAVMTIADDEVRIRSLDATIRRIQKRVREFIPAGVSLVDELIADRRAAGAREETERTEWLAKYHPHE
jgi:AbrB family looped-hinge helix DNA binding protein